MKILQSVLLLVTSLFSVNGLPMEPTGFTATATARLTAPFIKREIHMTKRNAIPNRNSVLTKASVLADGTKLLVDATEIVRFQRNAIVPTKATVVVTDTNRIVKRRVIPTLHLRITEALVKREIIPTDATFNKAVNRRFRRNALKQRTKRHLASVLKNKEHTILKSNASKGNKRTKDEEFILDAGANVENIEKFEDEDDEEDDEESVAPTDTTSLAQDSSTDLSKPIVEVNEQNGDVAAAQGKSTTTETVHENVVASGSGLEGFENSQEEEDDSDEDIVRPTESAERKAKIHHPKLPEHAIEEENDETSNESNEESRKTTIEKQQDDEMDRLMKLETDIEKMADDFSAKKRSAIAS